MGQQPHFSGTMNPGTMNSPAKTSARASGYHQKAMAEIHNSLLPFAKSASSASDFAKNEFTKNNSNNNSGAPENIGSSAASTISTLSTTSGVSSASGMSTGSNNGNGLNADIRQSLQQLVAMGYAEDSSMRALQLFGGRIDAALDFLVKQTPQEHKNSGLSGYSTKLIRKPSLERELNLHRSSPALDSGAGSSRSDSPRMSELINHPQVSRQYSPSEFGEPPPPPPPRCSSTPPPPPPPIHVQYQAVPQNVQHVPSNVQQLFKRMSPAPVVPSRPSPVLAGSSGVPPSNQRGTSPVAACPPTPTGVPVSSGRQPMVIQNGPQVQQQLTQQMQALSLYQTGGNSAEPPPPYPLIPTSPSVASAPPPSYTASIQSRQSPTQSQQDYRKSPSSGIYSGPTSAGSPSPVPVSTATPTAMARPTPLQAWGARQTKTQPPIIMQSVKSTQVQKPVLQTAIAPTSPQIATTSTPASPSQLPPPSYASSIQQKQQQQQQQQQQHVQQHVQQQQQQQQQQHYTTSPKPAAILPQSVGSTTTVTSAASATNVPTTEPPSYASTMQALAVQRAITSHPAIPPPPYTNNEDLSQVPSPHLQSIHHQPLQRKYSPLVMPADSVNSRSESPQSASSCESNNTTNPNNPNNANANNHILNHNHNHNHNHNSNNPPPLPPTASSSVTSKNNYLGMNGSSAAERKVTQMPPSLPPYKKIKHQSPIPERKHMSKEKEEERRDCKVRNYSPQAFKFFMEQHIENVLKSYKQRMFRRLQLETEMAKIGLSNEAQCQMRKMLSQKESNYIRLKRAKMDKSMFTKIKPIGVGAFGEVTLVRKIDTNHLYAMKTLRKADVLKRNQVAHVKAERDILAEADNEWVVKLYYSFQDKDNLYFVMDYIPGGDLMSLLIKLGIFEEPLARFYIAELTCAVESVHKMGFIHRDIKPDNILIDRDGHIKLTDFGLCTGFRWTHNSKYYQRNEHDRQDSMDAVDDWNNECRCKPLERRRKLEHQRCLAHSLVGTPNYIAPEVLQRTGYTQLCDWWSVGVILYEMLVGSPPFLANTPAETQYKVIHWETTLQIPPQANLSREGMDLILKLCVSADKRLGKNANEVKSHPFFKSIDFEKGLRRQVAPHIPKIEYPTDTSNFDPVDPDKLRNSGSSDSNKSDEMLDNGNSFHGFFEFTFRRFFDDGGGPAFNKINLDDNDNQGPVYV